MGGTSKKVKLQQGAVRGAPGSRALPIHLCQARIVDLLVTQRFDRIERSGFARRVKAKENSNRSTK